MCSRVEFIFDEVVRVVSSKRKDTVLIETVLESLQLRDKSVLEVGCGIGDNLICCIQKGAAYTEGFDISGKSIELAKSKTKDLPNTMFLKCSLKDYKTERKFDFILVLGVFEYLSNPLESLKKICSFLGDKGTLILLLSKPIFIKRASFLCRVVLSRLPLKAVLPTARFMERVLEPFSSLFNKMLYTGKSNTYTIEQTILEGLMVPRYNIFHHRIFSNYLRDEGFLINFFDGAGPSMVGIMAKKDNSKESMDCK